MGVSDIRTLEDIEEFNQDIYNQILDEISNLEFEVGDIAGIEVVEPFGVIEFSFFDEYENLLLTIEIDSETLDIIDFSL